MSHPFYSVSDLQIKFDLLDELTPSNKMKTLSNENQSIDRIYRLQQAECLYDYLLTNQRPSHCLPSTQRRHKRHQSQQSQFTSQNRIDSTIQPFQDHPILIPLEAYPVLDEMNSHFSTLDSHSAIENDPLIQEEHKFITSTALPPFGEEISLSFNLQLPQLVQQSQQLNSQQQQFETQSIPILSQNLDDYDFTIEHNDIQEISEMNINQQNIDMNEILTSFNFQLKIKKTGITPSTRIQIIDNSLQQPTSNISSTPLFDTHSTTTTFNSTTNSTTSQQLHHVTHLYGILSSTYEGYMNHQDGSTSQLILTILDKGKFEGILIHNEQIYAIQPPELVLPTYQSIDEYVFNQKKLVEEELMKDSNNNGENDNDTKQHFETMNKKLSQPTHLSQIDEILQQSSTYQPISSQSTSGQLFDTQSVEQITSKLDQFQRYQQHLDTLYTFDTTSYTTDLGAFTLSTEDIINISSLFFSQNSISELSIQSQDLNMMKYIATSATDFINSLPTINIEQLQPQPQQNSTTQFTTTQSTMNTTLFSIQRIFDCQYIDPETNEVISDQHHDHHNHNDQFQQQQHQNQHQNQHQQFYPQQDQQPQKRDLQRWTDCIKLKDGTIQTKDENLHIGMLIDTGAYIASNRNIGTVMGRLMSGIAWGNNIYPKQLGLHFVIDTVIIMSSYSPARDPSWNNDGNQKKTKTTNQLLEYVGQYRRTKFPQQLAILNLMTNLYPPPGVVGLAFLSSIGLSFHASSWANLSNFYFLTYIHELSHNIAAEHTFEANQGSIMSYDLSGRIGSIDPQNQGLVGLNSIVTKKLVCPYLSSVRQGTQRITSGSTRVPLDAIFSSYNGAICGNGIIEIGEECDGGLLNGIPSTLNGKICCTNDCRLTTGSTCTPIQLPRFKNNNDTSTTTDIKTTLPNDDFIDIISTTCCQECTAQPMDIQCGFNRSLGYCGRDGTCVISGCNSFHGVIPCQKERFQTENPCIQQCYALNQTNKDICFSIPFQTPLIYAQQGSHCQYQNGTHGICTIDNYPIPQSQLYQRPIPFENYIDITQKPYCKPILDLNGNQYYNMNYNINNQNGDEQYNNYGVEYHIIITDQNQYKLCGCDGYSTVALSCIENNINYVSIDKCLFELNQWYPPNSYIKCTPPPYCQI